MAAETIHDLLPIPPGTEKPHAYQIFGLQPGEQDRATINAAIAQRIAELKAVKAETDRELWKRAAGWVARGRAILTDPEKKAELDARFGIITLAADDAAPAADEPAHDPLAACLPQGDPLAAWQDPGQPRESSPAAAATEASAAAVTDSPSAQESAPATAAPATAESGFPVFVDAAPEAVPRRRKSSSLLLPAVTAGLVLLVGGLVYFVFWGPGGIEIRRGNGQLTLSTKTNARSDEDAASQRRDARDEDEAREDDEAGKDGRPGPEEARGSDPDMGDVSPAADDRSSQQANSLAADLQASGVAFDSADEPKPEDSPDAASSAASGDPPPERDSGSSDEARAAPPVAGAAADTDPTSMQDSPPVTFGAGEGSSPRGDARRPGESPDGGPTMPAGAASSPEQIDRLTAEADAAIERASEQIRAAKWDEMRAAAEHATDVAMTETQKELSQGLYQLADLAAYYRGGIERAVRQLDTGNELALTPSLSVLVVESGEDLLVVRRSARNYSYSLDELPFVVAYAVTPHSMNPEDPTTRAAKAAYQAVAPLATAAHRTQSLDWLAEISGEVEGADPARVADAIEKVFSNGGG